MKNKGFTLVEVLAMLTVLGILMLATIPNISGIVKGHKTNVMKSDITKMVNSAKTKMSVDKSIKRPQEEGQCVVLSLNYLNSSDDINKGPHDGPYLPFESYVVVKMVGDEYKYYIRLVEKVKASEYYGIKGDLYEDVTKENSKSMGKISSLQGITSVDGLKNVTTGGCTNTKIIDAK